MQVLPLRFRTTWRTWAACALAFLGLAILADRSEGAPSYQTNAGAVPVGEIRGVINPVMARYVERVIDGAEAQRAPLVVFTMDTPGGLDTSMRDITQRILRSQVPVAVFVSPPGSRAGPA